MRTVGTYGFEGTKRWCVQLVRTVLKVRNDGAYSWYTCKGLKVQTIISYVSLVLPKKEQCPFFPKTSLIDESRAMPLWPSCLNRVLILKVFWHIETG